MSKLLNSIIKEQELFVEQVTLTLKLLNIYKNNKKEFPLVLSKEIHDHYQFNWDNDEHIWESIDELTYDIVHKNKQFKFVSSGIFDTLHFSVKRNKLFEKNFKSFLELATYKWKI